MKPRELLIALGALVLGLLLGWVLSPGGADSERETSTDAVSKEASADTQEGAREGPGLARDDVADRRRVAPGGVHLESVPRTVIERAIDRASVSGPAVPTGDGVITGVVRDAEGLGLAGVAVAVRHRPSGVVPTSSRVRPDPPPAFRTAEDTLNAAADGWSTGRVGLRRTTTDESGAFRFEGLAEEQGLWLDVHHPDYVLEASWGYHATRPGLHHEFTALRVVEVTFDVRDERGAPVDAARILVETSQANRRTYSYVWSPEQPTFDLVAGDALILAVSHVSNVRGGSFDDPAKTALASARTRSVLVEEGMDVVGFVLESSRAIRVRPRLEGRVLASFRPRIEVCQLDVPEGQPVERRYESIYRFEEEFVFGALVGDRYAVRLLPPRGNDPLVEVEATVVAGEASLVELPIPTVVECPALRVRVRTFDGELAQWCDFERLHVDDEGQVTATRLSASRAGAGWNSVEFDARFEVVDAGGDGAPTHDPDRPRPTRTLRVLLPGTGALDVEVPRGERTLDVTFPAPGSLSVSLPVDWVGDPSVRLTLSMIDERALGYNYQYRVSEQFEADGKLFVEGIPPGRYQLDVTGRRRAERAPEPVGFPGSGIIPSSGGSYGGGRFTHREELLIGSGSEVVVRVEFTEE